MRFYVAGPGETSEEGVELADVETVLLQTAEAALAMARDRLDPSTTNVGLEVRSDHGQVGRVTVSVQIERA